MKEAVVQVQELCFTTEISMHESEWVACLCVKAERSLHVSSVRGTGRAAPQDTLII